MYSGLTTSEIAAEYQRTEGWKLFETACDLVADIDAYRATKGLSRSAISSLDIADAVLRIRTKPAQQLPTPEQTAFEQNLAQGTTADDAALAEYVATLDMRAYAAERGRLGTVRATAAFLAGL